METSKISKSSRSIRSRRSSRRWSLVVIGTGCLVFLFSDGVNYAAGVFLDKQQEEFEVDPFIISFVPSVSRGVAHISAIFIGPLTKLLGCSAVCMISFLIGAISLFVSSYANSVGFLCVSYGGFVGASFCGTGIPCLICATLCFRKHRGLAVGMITAGSGLGAFTFSPLSTYLIERQGWRSVYKLYAFLFLFGIIPAAFLKPQSPARTVQQYIQKGIRLWHKTVAKIQNQLPTRNRIEEQVSNISSDFTLEDESVEESDDEEIENSMVVHPVTALPAKEAKLGAATEELKRMRTLYHDHCVVLSSVAGFISTCAIYVPPVYLVSYAISRGIDAEEASFLLSVMGLANMVSRLVLGWFIDLKFLNSVIVYCLGTLLGGVSTLVVWKSKSYPPLVIYSLVYGFSFGCNISLLSVVLVQLMGLESFRDTFGIVNFWCGIGALCGAPLLGYMYEVTGEFNRVFLITGIVLSFGAFVWVITPFLMSKETVGPIRVYLSMSPDREPTMVTSSVTVAATRTPSRPRSSRTFVGVPSKGQSRQTVSEVSSIMSTDVTPVKSQKEVTIKDSNIGQ